MKKYTVEAAQFCDAIRELASKPENLENLESYLEYHFDKWMEKYGSQSRLTGFVKKWKWPEKLEIVQITQYKSVSVVHIV